MASDVIKGRHANLPNLEMKMTKLLIKLKQIKMKNTIKKANKCTEQIVSNTFDVDF